MHRSRINGYSAASERNFSRWVLGQRIHGSFPDAHPLSAAFGRLARPKLKVLLITGYAETTVVAKNQLEDGMGILTKPFAMDGLAARIKELISAG